MFLCCKCPSKFKIFEELVNHLKYIHFLSNSDTLECKQNNCNQIFSSFKAFRRHVLRFHLTNSVHLDDSACSSGTAQAFILEDQKSYVVPNENVSTHSDNTSTSLECLNSFQDALGDLKNKALQFCLYLHSEDNITRKDVLLIQKHVTALCSSIGDALNICSKSIECEKLNQNIRAVIEVCNNPFNTISTEHRFFNILKDQDLYQEAHSHEMQNFVTEIVSKGNPTLDSKSFLAYFMPLHFQIKTFFELPEILSVTLKNEENLKSKNKIGSFLNSEPYSNKIKLFHNKIAIPIFLYFDDYGVNNNIFAGYYSFPTVPQHMLSQLKFLFNCVFIKSDDYKQFGNEISLHYLIEELKTLEEEGIELNISGKRMRVYFFVGAILGDNLGLNTLLGFTKSFNSNMFCRSCRRLKANTKRDCVEISDSLRNEINYSDDLLKNDFKETGIHQNCVFNQIPSFHVAQNFVFDLMHDLFEGIFHYDICNILRSLVDANVISLDTLNSRKRLFQYGETEIGNISSSLIDMSRLQSLNLKMSGRESWTFLHFLTLMIGDLVPKNNQPWKLLCLLIQVVDTLLLPVFTVDEINLLRTIIREHNKLYIKLYGDLKPKHHFLVHYPTCILKCGPPRYLWSFRFEGKHQSSKRYSNNTSSRKNLPHTLSIKAGLKYAKFLVEFKHGLDPECFFESVVTMNLQHVNVSKANLTPNQVKELQTANISEVAKYRGKKYSSNLYLTKMLDSNVKLYKIIYLARLSQNSLYVLSNEIEVMCLDNHFQAFQVGRQLNNESQLFQIEYFTSPPLHIYTANNGKVYLRNNYL